MAVGFKIEDLEKVVKFFKERGVKNVDLEGSDRWSNIEPYGEVYKQVHFRANINTRQIAGFVDPTVTVSIYPEVDFQSRPMYKKPVVTETQTLEDKKS